ncbi:MAG: hypothetical protein AB7E96_05810 [Deferribacterales bacterium]
MKEKALEIRKQILPMKDAYEELDPEERIELKQLQKEHDELYSALSDADKKWYDDKFGTWYTQYLEVETKIFIKPCEG